MDGRQIDEPLPLLALIEPSRWQRLQDHFSSVLGVLIRTVSPSHELLVNPSWPVTLEAERIVRWFKVGEELEQLLPVDHLPTAPSCLTTPLGVTYAAVPVRATSEQISALFVLGPIVVGPREAESQFRYRVGGMDLDAQVLWPLLLSLKLYTFTGIRAALNLMEEVGTSMAQLAFQAKHPPTIHSDPLSIDEAVVTSYTERILHSLLEVATLATKAEGGSVMMYDARRSELKIQVADGLSATVIANARLKRGEGIAGLAATQHAILLIDRDTTDERIKHHMSRRDIVSSLIAPVALDPTQEPLGVLSLRTSNPGRRFTKEHVELIRRLLDLAGAVLGSLQSLSRQARLSATS